MGRGSRLTVDKGDWDGMVSVLGVLPSSPKQNPRQDLEDEAG
jgi:hypothetical protein